MSWLTCPALTCPDLPVCCINSHHFRACLSAVVGSAACERIATADGGGLGSTLLALTAPYRRLRR